MDMTNTQELQAMLAATGGEVKNFIARQEKAAAELADQNRELKTRMLDLEQKGAHRPGGGDYGGGDNSFAPIFDASDGYKSLLRGETKSVRIAIPAKALQRKSIISTISGGTISPPDHNSEIIAPSQRRLMIRNLIPSIPTNAGSTDYVRELTYTNNAGPQYDGSSPAATTEGSQKNASDMTLQLINSPVITIAHHFTVSRQALDDSAALAQQLETRGIYGWQLAVDQMLLTGDGSSGTLNGLINNAVPFAGGQTNQTGLDTIRKAITQLAVGDHIADGIVLNPRDAEALELAKDSQQRYMDCVRFVNGQAIVWRVNIIESNAMPAASFLVGDFLMAATIRDRQEAHVEISLDHLDYRTRNLALILIEGRLGLEIHRQTALCYGSLTNAG